MSARSLPAVSICRPDVARRRTSSTRRRNRCFSRAAPGLARVVPGNKKRSLLWLNLASATLPSVWQVAAADAARWLGAAQHRSSLALVQLWIEQARHATASCPAAAS